tara:strand:+ start:2624 stop:3994 length:1371 start_codon:yes stop_codon:yes gene_type:complete
MKKRLFPLLIALSALAVSGSAAFYSVFGLSKLFAGASTQVIIMAGSLEFAKLVVASLLYQYWDTINRALKIYLSIACFILILITSGGIYGFLSGAYQETATKSEFLDKSLIVLETKQNRFEENKNDLTLEKTQLNTTISDLRTSLSNPTQVSYYSEEAGQVITTSSSSARKALQKELDATIQDRNDINLKLEAVQDSIMRLDTELLELEIGNEEQRELGPLKYLAETTGYPMGEVVNWFLLLIIFVFDPLAIALVVAANFAFSQIKPKVKEMSQEKISRELDKNEPWVKVITKSNLKNGEDVKMSAPEGMEFNKPYPMPKSWYDPNSNEGIEEMLEKQKKELDIDEQRMNIIGQNGNDGLHYDNVITTTENLTDEQIEDLSKEIGKTETLKEEKPINPKEEDLEKLAKALNIKYDDENVDLDRLTDTTQTLLTKTINKEEKEEDKGGETLKYKGRK